MTVKCHPSVITWRRAVEQRDDDLGMAMLMVMVIADMVMVIADMEMATHGDGDGDGDRPTSIDLVSGFCDQLMVRIPGGASFFLLFVHIIGCE